MSQRIFRSVAMLGTLLLLLVAAVPALAYHDDPDTQHEFADPAFQNTWERTDKLVAETGDDAPRTWIWGPSPYTEGMMEDYAESPGGERLVQYFDKSRMELNCPADAAGCEDVDEDSPWYVTNGLLVVEMVMGHYQTGDAEFDEDPEPADVNIVGDPGQHPTYADINEYGLMDEPAAENGTVLNQRFNDDGTIEEDESFNDENVTAAYHVTVPNIDHQVASVFWDFMNSTGQVWENGAYVTDNLFENAFYATGYPVTEAYWSTVAVDGTDRDVLWQCFERRCLTYTPGNPAGFLVEAGNVGQHYYTWRHGEPTPGPDALLFDAALNGDNERPDPVETEATGHAWFYLDGDILRFRLDVENIENATAAHIHLGGADVTGDVIVPLFMTETEDDWFSGSGNLARGQITADMLSEEVGVTWDELLDLMGTGGVYVNVHTDANPPGEIRGQVGISDNVELSADLSGENERPDPVDTDATGSATYTFHHDTDSVDFELSVASIDNVTAAHIHLGGPNATGPVVAPLFMPEAPVDPDDGVLNSGTLHADDLMNDLEGEPIERLVWEMVSRNTYTNVHSTEYPSGEIRGQNMLVIGDEPQPETDEYTVMLFGINGSGVTGTGTIEPGAGPDTWNVTLNVEGLEENDHMAHIHGFADDDAGTVAFCPTPAQDTDPADGIISLAEGSTAYGDVLFPFQDLAAGADGTAAIADLTITHDFTGTPLRNNAFVLHGMTVDPDGEGGDDPAYDETVPVACGLIVPNDDTGFIAELSGDQVVPDAVVTDTTGTFVARLNADGTVLSWQLHFVDAEMINDARVFEGAAGEEGDTLFNLFLTESQPFEGTGQYWSGLVEDPEGALTLDDVVAEMQSDNAYVQAGLSTGDGEYDALVRGQVMTMEAYLAT